MKFTLTDYQADAVADLLTQLDVARRMYHPDDTETEIRETSVALTAPTGAGKTVMAAATIEALFFGSAQFDFKADPTAVVIWFSDSPNLNDQSRFRLMQASEKLTPNILKTIEPRFAQRELYPGHVYFLNTQKLQKNSLLVRGHKPKNDGFDLTDIATPDMLEFNIWQTIGNTIDNEDLTVYFVLDEAHRGFDTKPANERATVVRRLVSGEETERPMPIVVGISATIERFKVAMDNAAAAATNRLVLPSVEVSPTRVQESGLLKDAVALQFPNEVGTFDTTLVAEATKMLQQSTIRWKRYAQQQKAAEAVVPLMVLQIPNTPDPDQVGAALDKVLEIMPDLQPSAFRHVLGENNTQSFGSWTVDYIEPQRVQETTEVRVLVAKEAISTGWDCPRAEVLISFRPAQDQTHIAQLLGRMVRSPLAMRIPGNEMLNTVDCFLPFFNTTAAGKVARYITGQSDELTAGAITKVLIEPRELEPNPDVDESVWECFDSLATQSVPKRNVRPITRLVTLAQALASDGLRPNALVEATARTHKVLDASTAAHPEAMKKAIDEILKVRIQVIKANRASGKLEYLDRKLTADERAIRTGFELAQGAFGADVSTSYVNHLLEQSVDDDDLRAAYIKVSALATVAEARLAVDVEANVIASDWFETYRSKILTLSDERQQEYDNIRSMATEPQTGLMRRPRNRIEDFSVVDTAGQVSKAPLAKKHLLSDANGDCPLSGLNNWEQEVVNLELAKPETVAWYRNPSHNGADSLTVAYIDDVGGYRSMHPDFVFFEGVDGKVRPSIVDPHGTQLEDSLVKLRGLAQFADRYGNDFNRILAVIKVGNAWKALDLKRADVRDAVASHVGSVNDLYALDIASFYL
jgi:type III restriction enzyme